MLDDGALRFGSNTSRPSIATGTNTTTISNSGNTLLLISTSDNVGHIANHTGAPNTTAWKDFRITGAYTASSATIAAGISLEVSPTINTTSTYSNSFTGIAYNPTLTATTGLTHYGITITPVAALSGFATATPLSTLETARSFAANTTALSANTTLDSSHYAVMVDATSGNITITLPAASGCTKRIYIIKKIDSSANTITIARTGANTIDGATSKVINVQYAGYGLQSDGTNYNIIGSF